ncbi:hypothetical protein E8E12_010968 [Didymella heteroderae]|uniref:Uncharacterized protein n=1 Tax=Didymella heteroderae TaxID=1769908 RepID=A0A9P4WZH4_9PLEO|nr:hypothetical protein E8E12_010968 [Didymella heteroderae]
MMDKLLMDAMNNTLHGSDQLVSDFSSAQRQQNVRAPINFHNLVEVMKEFGYLGADRELYNMAEHLGRVFTGSAINTLWEMDRSYFVWIDNPGGCEQEKTIYKRGPTEYLICLPELAQYGFWFYQIDTYHEGNDRDAMVRGPTGFWLLEGSTKYYNITLQNITRSAEWVHRNDFIERKGDKIDTDSLNMTELIHQGLILDEKGQNYPCACGEFNWRHGIPYAIEKDETEKFLARTGLMFSTDWSHWCDHKNNCKDVKDLNTTGKLESLRQKGDPEIPGDISSFFDCRNRRDSKKHTDYPDKDRAQ